MRPFHPSRLLLCLTAVLALLLCGCSFITVNIKPELKPLEEKTVQGEGDDKVLLVSISGVIMEDKSGGRFALREKVGQIARLKEELRKAAKDPRVKAVVVRINSPGGGVTASDIVFNELARFRQEKKVPMVACLMSVAASGGYYAACACDRIIAHPTTITGSIGVIAFKVNARGLLGKIGIEDETMAVPDKKDMVSPLRSMTPEEREIFRGLIVRLDERFLKVVTGARRLTPEQLAKATDGRIVDGMQAVDLGLADETGYLDDAINRARELAGVPEARVVTYARPGAYRENIYSELGESQPTALIPGTEWLEMMTPGVHFMYLWAP